MKQKVLLVFILALFFTILSGSTSPSSTRIYRYVKETHEPKTVKIFVTRVVDGDTIKYKYLDSNDTETYTGRFLAIDVPEAKCNSKMVRLIKKLNLSYSKVQQLVRYGRKAKKIVLKYVNNKNKILTVVHYGKGYYSRELIYIKELNEILLRKGYASLYTVSYLPKDIKERTKKLEQEAREKRVGIWKKFYNVKFQ